MQFFIFSKQKSSSLLAAFLLWEEDF